MSRENLRPTTTYPAIVGKVLTDLRQQRGIQQGELARAVGLTQSTWSKIEKGSSALTVEQLAVAATKLGTTASTVLSRTERVMNHLQQQGVRVERTRVSWDFKPGFALLSAAALGGIIGTLFAKKDED